MRLMRENELAGMGLLLLASVLVLGTPGCGEDGPPLYLVSGQVTYQGAPVQQGVISFRPDYEQGGKGQVCAAQIVDGEYIGQVTKGPKRVEIYATWELPGEFVTIPATGKKLPKMASLPAKYNDRSTLTTRIKPTENVNVDFHLE